VTSHHALLAKKEKEKENTKLENKRRKREEIEKHLKSTLANSDNHDNNMYLP